MGSVQPDTWPVLNELASAYLSAEHILGRDKIISILQDLGIRDDNDYSIPVLCIGSRRLSLQREILQCFCKSILQWINGSEERVGLLNGRGDLCQWLFANTELWPFLWSDENCAAGVYTRGAVGFHKQAYVSAS